MARSWIIDESTRDDTSGRAGPLHQVWPIVYLDALVVRVRDKGVAKHAGILSALSDSSLALSRSALFEGVGHLERDGSASRASGGLDGDDTATMIHAQEGLGVVEVPLGRWWRRRAVAAFRFPDSK